MVLTIVKDKYIDILKCQKKIKSLSMLVVLYGCDVFDSITVRTVIDTILSSNNINLVVWNNGPDFLAIPKDFIGVKMLILFRL